MAGRSNGRRGKIGKLLSPCGRGSSEESPNFIEELSELQVRGVIINLSSNYLTCTGMIYFFR